MVYIIFVVGPISSGKSSFSGFARPDALYKIEDIYDESLGEMSFDVYGVDKKFQADCWGIFKQRIMDSHESDESVIAESAGTNSNWKSVYLSVKNKFPDETFLVEIESSLDELLRRSDTRGESDYRPVGEVKSVYHKFMELKSSGRYVAPDFRIVNDSDFDEFRRKVDEVIESICEKCE